MKQLRKHVKILHHERKKKLYKTKRLFFTENIRLQVDLIWLLVSILQNIHSVLLNICSNILKFYLHQSQPRRDIKTFPHQQSVLVFLLFPLIKSTLLLPLSFFSSWASLSNIVAALQIALRKAILHEFLKPILQKCLNPSYSPYDISLNTFLRNMKSLLVTIVPEMSFLNQRFICYKSLFFRVKVYCEAFISPG